MSTKITIENVLTLFDPRKVNLNILAYEIWTHTRQLVTIGREADGLVINGKLYKYPHE